MDYEVLKSSSLFSHMREDEVSEVLAATSFHTQHYGRNEVIVHAMDPADRIGLILEGKVQAEKTFPNGSQINVTVRDQGSMIGPAAAFSSIGRYPCDLVALEDTDILFFSRQDLFDLMGRNPTVMQNITRQLATAAYMLQRKIELLSYNGISQKIAFYLLEHTRLTGKNNVPIPGSMTKWALLMNVSRPSLHRELKKMEEAGLICHTSPSIEIKDPEGLQNILSE